MTDTQHPCASCHAALASAAAERVHTETIRAEIAAMFSEAKQLLAKTIELNRRAALDLAQTNTVN